ncbi:hypothetical protein Sjap_018600 [Stephania japonica]|uniref:Plant heme peroxidase family profile domain-containing protein n=1 Tax=Stephania japonica TaxID=461633 RepID=A0AAP0I8D8_9MAGN
MAGGVAPITAGHRWSRFGEDSDGIKAQKTIKITGLSWTFYGSSCPQLETIISDQLWQVFQEDYRQAAGLLRLHIHDCFVQGWDGSVLVDGFASGPIEKNAPPNLTLRPEGFTIIEDMRHRVHEACGPVVSCSDIVALAARDSVYVVCIITRTNNIMLI